MNSYKNQSQHNALLWWVAIIALAVSGALFVLLKGQAEVDVAARQQRILFPLAGIVIAGICLITGTAKRWFK